jgi:hypothetical protein
VTEPTLPHDRPRGDLVLRIGIGITVAGLLFTLVAVLPLVLPSLELPSAMWLLSMITGVGLVVIFVGLARAARSRRAR